MEDISELKQQAESVIDCFVEKAKKQFPGRIQAAFKFGSLGAHGGFSACSDVDVVLILDEVKR